MTMSDDERRMLADSARRYLDETYDGAARAASQAHPHGCRPQAWSAFAQLGWLALPLPQAHGGLDCGLPELCLVAEEMGRAVVVEPFVACGVLAPQLLLRGAGGELQARWLPRMAEGRLRVAAALPSQPGQPFRVRLREDGPAPVLDGDLPASPGVAGADALLVTANADDGSSGIFLVEAGAAGLAVDPRRFYDGRAAAAVALRAAVGQPVFRGPHAQVEALVADARDQALLVHAAETVGTMARAFGITLDHVTTRRQFGRTVAANQVVQHRLVDLYVAIEETRALVQAAAQAPTPRLVSAAGAGTADAARQVWEESVQLHGAIGMTEEYPLGACVRRLALASSLYGAAHHHLERLASHALGEPA